MSTSKPKKAGCEKCRARHVKCEGGLPCVRCKKRGLECTRVPRTRFRQVSILGQSQLEFPGHQTWCKTSGRSLDIVDQTLETIRDFYDGDRSGGNVAELASSRPSNPSHESGTSTISSLANESFAAGNANIIISDAVVNKATDILNPPESNTSLHSHMTLGSFDNLQLSPSFPGFSPPTTGSRTHPDSIVPPATHPSYLDDYCDLKNTDVTGRQKLESFLELVGPAIDPCDPYAALATDIIERALTNPRLLSPVIQLGEMQDPSVTIPFHQSLYMDDYLSNGADTLVVAFLYRILDNLRGLSMESTSFDRMKSIRDAIDNLAMYPEEESGFIHRIIWASLRQEVFIAIMNHEDACLGVDQAPLHVLRSTSEDEQWTNRIFLQLISVVQHCFGDGKTSVSYDMLVDDLASWVQQRPATFQPIFFESAKDGQTFPEIWFLNHFAAAASQYYLIARIMLILHNPRMPRLGPAKRDAAKHRDDQVLSDVHIICGIAVSRQAVNPLYLGACIAIALAGDRCTDAKERTLFLEILVSTQNRYGWSTVAVQEYLEDSWR